MGIKFRLNDIFIYGSSFTTIRTPNHKALDRREEQGIIIGNNDDIEGYRVLFTRDRVVRTTQHIQNIKTLSEKANAQLIRKIIEGFEG